MVAVLSTSSRFDVVIRGLLAFRRVEAAPLVRQFHLEVHAQLVGRLEGRFRRTPGMEAIVIDAVRAGDRQHPQPAGLVHRRVAGQGEEAAVELAAEEDRAAVDGELVSTGGEAAHGERHRPHVGVRLAAGRRFQPEAQAEHGRLEFVPQRRVVAGLVDELDGVLRLRGLDVERLRREAPRL